jgi:hypothetical protein
VASGVTLCDSAARLNLRPDDRNPSSEAPCDRDDRVPPLANVQTNQRQYWL